MVSEQPYRTPTEKQADEAPPQPTSAFTWLALLVALATALGSVWLTLGLHVQVAELEQYKLEPKNLIPCPLCYYQRTFALAAFGVLFLGLLTGANSRISLSLLAIPAAVGGLAVAGFHVYLEMEGKLECPMGLADLTTVPKQSLAGFGGLTLLLLIDVLLRREDIPGGAFAILISLVVGGALTAGCLYSAPPLPAAPKEPYKDKLLKCRPPYHEQEKVKEDDPKT